MSLLGRSRQIPLALLLLLGACGSGGPSPTPTPAPRFDVQFVVFYDQNDNGIQDGDEHAVVPNATVLIRERTGVTAPGTGAVTVAVEAGTWTATLAELPAYYQRGHEVSVTVPVADGQPIRMPASLAIGANHPNLYMAFGDSITDGDGSDDFTGYRRKLQEKLAPWFLAGQVVNQGIGGTRSNAGAARIKESLDDTTPAFTLVLYGTNDWNDSHCRSEFPCFTIDSLRRIVRTAKNAGSKPILSTIIPCNTGYDARVPPSRNVWIASMNELIVQMAQEEGVVVADSYTAMMAVPDFHTLMFDHVHPNEAGYDIIAQTWFDAITRPSGQSALSHGLPELLTPDGGYPETIPSDPADEPRPPRWSSR